jgi:tetratricopeptide (TPR) repeat protein
VKELFEEARDLPPEERDDFLERACADEPRLRTEVEQLLEAHEAAGSFLGSDGATRTMETAEKPGTVIGRYKLLQQIGEGGFGSVYMAEQERPVRRKVALKIIKLGMDTKQVIARFEAERQALALMDHPNIAKVLDAGSTETGRPYFVMELVRGVPITEYCDDNNLSTRDRLRLFQKVCGAVQHAHQKGIIHRDIKPSNVMITLHDGVPVPKVIDFGIAKATNQRLTEKTLFTEYRQFIGTPQYMSPEQAEMSGLDVDTRADIYSLGVLLYELLTGTTPFDPERLRSLAFSEIHRVIREEDPHKPSTRISTLGDQGTTTAKHRRTDVRALRKALAGDLDWIVMKALEKDRTRRYDTANALLLDIGRHLESEPVSASPPGAAYRIGKFLRRNRTAVGVAGVVTAALLVGLAVATYGFLEARRERVAAQHAADAAESANAFFADMLAAVNPQQLHLHSAFRVAALPPDAGARFSHDVSVAEMLKRSARRAEVSFEGQPEQEATMREILGTTLLGLDEAADALAEFRRAYELRRELHGEEQVDVLRSRIQIATALQEAGMPIEAESAFENVIADLERIRGPEDPLAMFAGSQLAMLLVMKGELSRSDSICALVLERQERVLGENHRDTLATLQTWTNAYSMRGMGSEAVERASKAYERAVATYGPDDAIVMNIEGALALSYAFLGQLNRSKEILFPLLEKVERIYGKDASRTRGLHFILARAHGARGEEELQIDHYLKALRAQGEASNARYGAGFGWFAARDVSRELTYRRRYDEAIGIVEAEYERFRGLDLPAGSGWDDRRKQALRSLRTECLGVFAMKGRWAGRQELLREELQQLRDAALTDDADAADLNAYAWALVAVPDAAFRDSQEGLRIGMEAVDRFEEDEHTMAGLVWDTVARAHELNGDLEEALEAERRSVEGFARSGTESGLEIGPSTSAVVRYALELGDRRAARAAVDRAMTSLEEIYGADASSRSRGLCLLGQQLEKRGFGSFSEEPFRRAVEAARNGGAEGRQVEPLCELAILRAKAGDLPGASRLTDEAWDIYRQYWIAGPIEWVPGLGRDGTGKGERSRVGNNLKVDLVRALLATGRVAEARELHEQILCVGGWDDCVLTPRLLVLEGRVAEAEYHWHKRVAGGWMNRDEQNDPLGLACYESGWGRCLMELGRWEEAEEQLRRARDRYREWGGSGSEHLDRVEARLAACERHELDEWWTGGW